MGSSKRGVFFRSGPRASDLPARRNDSENADEVGLTTNPFATEYFLTDYLVGTQNKQGCFYLRQYQVFTLF